MRGWMSMVLGFGLALSARAQVTNAVRVQNTYVMLPATWTGESFNAMQFVVGNGNSLQLWPRVAVEGGGSGGTGEVSTAQLLVVSNQVQAVTNRFRSDVSTLQSADATLTTKAANLEGATNGLRTDVQNLQGATNGMGVRLSNIEALTNGIGSGPAGGGWSGVNATATNATFWSDATNATNVIVRQTTGQAVPLISVLNSNGAPIAQVDNRGFLTLSNGVTDYNQPTPTNWMALGVDNYAGRNVPEWWDQYGLSLAVQPALFNNRVVMIYPSSGTTIGIIGAATANTGGTTIAHPNRDQTFPYMIQCQTAATSNSNGGFATSVDLALCSTGAGSVYNRKAGFFYAVEFCTTNGTASVSGGGGSPRLFTGLTATASPNYTNIVQDTNATGNYLGLFASSRDTTNMWISARDSAAEFRTNTGIPFQATNLYQFYLFNAPTSTFVGWRIKDMTSGASANGWFSNNVPTNIMKMVMAYKNSTSLVHSVRVSKMYLESPLNP